MAAESAFLAHGSTAAADESPLVVVKRKRTVVTDGNGLPESLPGHPGASRAPKVYRVEHGPTPDTVDESREATGPTGSAEDASVQAVSSIKKRRRVRRHGEVTIIHPQPSDDPRDGTLAAGAQASAAAAAEPSYTNSFLEDITALERRALADRAAIQSEIRKLERQADAARKVEAAGAVRWIRKAIAEYKLASADLGL